MRLPCRGFSHWLGAVLNGPFWPQEPFRDTVSRQLWQSAITLLMKLDSSAWFRNPLQLIPSLLPHFPCSHLLNLAPPPANTSLTICFSFSGLCSVQLSVLYPFRFFHKEIRKQRFKWARFIWLQEAMGTSRKVNWKGKIAHKMCTTKPVEPGVNTWRVRKLGYWEVGRESTSSSLLIGHLGGQTWAL